MNDGRCFRISVPQDLVQFLLREIACIVFAERILAEFLERLTPAFDKIPECSLAGPVANKAFIVLEFTVVTIDIYGRQAFGRMRDDGRLRNSCDHVCPQACVPQWSRVETVPLDER